MKAIYPFIVFYLMVNLSSLILLHFTSLFLGMISGSVQKNLALKIATSVSLYEE